MHALSFLPFEYNFFNFPNLNGINCTPKLRKNKWIEKQYRILEMRVRSFPWLRYFNAQ